MPSEEASNKAVVQRWHTQVWDEGPLDQIGDFVADDYVEHSSAHSERHGPSEVRQEIEQLRSAFPDLSVIEEDTIAEGDKVVSRLTFSGSHEGSFQGMEPTGTEVTFEAIAINPIEDGQIVEAWVQTDAMGLMQQLGDVGPPGD